MSKLEEAAVAPLSPRVALALLSLAIVLILPAALGPAFAVYALIVLAAAAWVRLIGRVPALAEVILFALGPWWVGAWAWGGTLSPLSLWLALAFAVCLSSGLNMPEWRRPYRLGLGAALFVLLLAGRAFAAGSAGILFISALARSRDPQADFRAVRLPLAAGMLIGALASAWAGP